MDQKTEELPEIANVNVDEEDVHLQRLLLKQEPFLTAAIRNVKEYFNPPKLPPLVLTSAPIAVKDIWGQSAGNESKAGVTSAIIHVVVVTVALIIGTSPAIQKMVKDHVSLVAPPPFDVKMMPKKDLSGGGGGGGSKAPTPVSQGKMPKPAPKQFVPPMIAQVEKPKIAIDPTIIAPPDANLPQINADNFGDPLSKYHLPSNGTGSGAGMGSGSGGGLGSGKGGGYGAGSGGGVGGGAYRIGGGVSAPKVIFQVEPEYSEDARKAKFQGTVVIALVVDEKGNPREIRVVRPLGMGLDQKAIEAVEKWRFRPGQKDGKAVPTQATIEVSFRLL